MPPYEHCACASLCGWCNLSDSYVSATEKIPERNDSGLLSMGLSSAAVLVLGGSCSSRCQDLDCSFHSKDAFRRRRRGAPLTLDELHYIT